MKKPSAGAAAEAGPARSAPGEPPASGHSLAAPDPVDRGRLRAALLIALLQTPHRFRSKRQLWAYSGLGLETHDSAEYRFRDGQLERARKQVTVRGLNRNRNRHLKELFKSAAIGASTQPGPFADYYAGLLQKAIKPAMARLTLARKIAAIVLAVWKKGECFDQTKLNTQAA